MMNVIRFTLRSLCPQFFVLLVLGCVVCGPASAQQQFFAPQPSFDSIQGIVGPATANLGETAEIVIPEGCKFVEPNIARILLDGTKNPVPSNLAGLLVPNSGKWFAILQLASPGYVSDKEHLDGAAILKTVRRDIARQNKENEKTGVPAVADVTWQLPPVYDSGRNTLEYAIKAGSKDGSSVNHVVNLLGRRGVLSVTSVHPWQPNLDLASVKAILKGISFKPGERYGDHKPDDRLARSGLVALITNANDAALPKLTQADMLTIGLWSALGLSLLVGGWVMTSLVIKSRKARYYRMKGTNGHSTAAASLAGTNGHSDGVANHQILPHINGNGKLAKHGRRRRKKLFSYHAFYSDMVMNLTRCNYEGTFGAMNGEGSEGQDERTSHNGHRDSSPMAGAAQQLLVTETSKLIVSQQKLIEGQRKLIEEQSKLIQEKSRLIDAESKVLEKQSELMI